jgi:hypothetical protein
MQDVVAGTSSPGVVAFDMARETVTAAARCHGDDVNAICFVDAECNMVASGSDDTCLFIHESMLASCQVLVCAVQAARLLLQQVCVQRKLQKLRVHFHKLHCSERKGAHSPASPLSIALMELSSAEWNARVQAFAAQWPRPPTGRATGSHRGDNTCERARRWPASCEQRQGQHGAHLGCAHNAHGESGLQRAPTGEQLWNCPILLLVVADRSCVRLMLLGARAHSCQPTCVESPAAPDV